MAPATELDGRKDPPGTPRIVDQFRRFRDTISLFQKILLATPNSEQITITSTNMNPTPLNVVLAKTVIVTLDDYEEVTFVANDELPPLHASLTPSIDI